MPVEYDDDLERRRTHPLLLPKIEIDRVSLPDGDILERIAVVAPVKKVAKPGPMTRREPYRVISVSQFHREQSRRRN